jgi:monoterpene epsilon-lactone hydrolase
LSGWVRTIVRRRDWGDKRKLAIRARALFGIPSPLQPLYSSGVDIKRIADAAVTGEWITPRDTHDGVILYYHGGGYVACSPATHRPITTRLAKTTKLTVFATDYRLAPEHKFPAALDDAVAAYGWLLQSGKVSPEKIALAGDSAGGGLVLAVLVRLRDEGAPLPACAVCLSPWTDLSGSGESVKSNDGRCAMFFTENIRAFAALYLGAASARDPLASPAFADLSRLPPLLAQVGSTELLLDDARRVHEAILASGGTSVLDTYDDVPHGWQMLDPLVPESREALRSAGRFITSHIGSTRQITREPQ